MIPKSTAPSEIRLAGVRVASISVKAPNIANGMLISGNKRGAEIAQKKHQHQKDQRHPDGQVLEHRMQRGIDQSGAVVVGHCADSPWA